MRILLVEDNKMNQLVALRMLDKIGFAAEVAADGNAAIGMIKAKPFDLVLMDCQMPGMDGFDTTRIIREMERAAGIPGTPVIGVSAKAESGERDEAIAAGMDDHLTKPMRVDDLQRAIERWLGAPVPPEGAAPAPLSGV